MSKIFQFGVNSQGVESRFVYLFMKTKKISCKIQATKIGEKSEIKNKIKHQQEKTKKTREKDKVQHHYSVKSVVVVVVKM